MDDREKGGTGHPQHPQNTAIAFPTSARTTFLSHPSPTHPPPPLGHPITFIPQDPEKHRFPHSTPHPSLLQSPPALIAIDAINMSPTPRGPYAGASTRSLDGSRASRGAPSPAKCYINAWARDCLCLCCLQRCVPQPYLHNK